MISVVETSSCLIKMEQFLTPESTSLEFDSESSEGDLPVYGADFSSSDEQAAVS